MTKNIVVCADGTWNRPTVQTNVWQLFRSLPGYPNSVPASLQIGAYLWRNHDSPVPGTGQIAFYLPGVGTTFSHNDPMAGAVGIGLHDKVLDGYILISRVYTPGDPIYIFGFSRGAYTARSLAGFIAKAGLLSKAEAKAPDCRSRANALWWDFKHKTLVPHANDPTVGIAQPIALVGVWDTVGAQGIPFFNGVHVVDEFEKKWFDFADNDLSSRVANGRHAVSVDEKRQDFLPTLWNDRAGVAERWFAGVHSDVGGGYNSRELADVTLEWMVNEARGLGLALHAPPATHPDALADRHESCVDLWTLRQEERSIAPTAVLDPSVPRRLAGRADYRPAPLAGHPACSGFYGAAAPPEQLNTTDPTAPIQRLAVNTALQTFVAAERWWNAVGIEVLAGERYRFEASGCWSDAKHFCDADGWVGLGWLTWTRRMPACNWFHLCLSVSSRPALELKNPSLWSGLYGPVLQQDAVSALLPIGKEAEVVMPRAGYLYLFANDAPSAYGNNSGSLDLTVTRLA